VSSHSPRPRRVSKAYLPGNERPSPVPLRVSFRDPKPPRIIVLNARPLGNGG